MPESTQLDFSITCDRLKDGASIAEGTIGVDESLPAATTLKSMAQSLILENTHET